MTVYIAIKGDIVRSRAAKDRQGLQERLFQSVEDANRRFAQHLTAHFAVTHGDEIQGLLSASSAASALAICEHFVDALAPQRVRFGLGIGTLATALRPVAIGMDGEAWHRSDAALQRARARRHAFVLVGGPPEGVDSLNAIVDFLLSHRMGWTQPQRESVQMLLQLGSRAAVADQLRISRAAVSKRLSGCLWDQYEALRTVAEHQLKACAAAFTPMG